MPEDDVPVRQTTEEEKRKQAKKARCYSWMKMVEVEVKI